MPGPARLPGAHRAGWMGTESAPARTKPPARNPHAAGGQKEPPGPQKATRPVPALGGQSEAPAPGGPSAPACGGTLPTLTAGRRARSAARAPPTLARRGTGAPSGRPSLSRRPTMGSPRRRRGAETRAPVGPRQHDPAPTCLPPPRAAPHSRETYFSRACPSEGTAEPFLWQTWLAG